MKRLRAPEQSDSKATTPAAGATLDSAAPQAAADLSAPLSTAAPEGAPVVVTEVPALTGQPAPEAAAAAAEPQQPSPAPQEAESTSRCNGETLTSLHATAEAKDEQG